ncbi:hypothetical protein AB0F43_31780 [Kribbella sp. NPDC023972]|uniref:hypothetical protein n=1 Tax=Kribbella sp. NPDC023972 TaxID=3154795 RepID=UPI0033D88090
MTATISELDQQLLENFAPACEGFYIEHRDPPQAEWIIHWVCCLPSYLLTCTGCKDTFLGLPADLRVDRPGYQPPQTAAHLIEPLHGRPR